MIKTFFLIAPGSFLVTYLAPEIGLWKSVLIVVVLFMCGWIDGKLERE